ncbi:DUF2703 domain-containing protein [Maridesulfovibrio ferrireducens]|uniref:DUF2703 domain-containing protein n=1 Tax=Maridesulfovibrio ferrireducens TaxID=246191 RepID=UPI001A1E2143|nr:DUF2703 domain-containing protein [Maridesulfovibrio ferrireducens]MBI9112754.1 DUF2703 domain-containing protein [Maridesulfovibrio ferrireducens]
MMKMVIKWQRLVNDAGETCERCSCTGEATEAAFDKLRLGLREIGIKVQLETISIDQNNFFANPIDSNRILIDDISLEEWLDGIIGSSKCCGPCGDSECRTLIVAGQSYEAIPEQLIIRAGLLAAAAKFKGIKLIDDLRH